MSSPAAPIPTGTSSSLAGLFALLYRSYSRDPLSTNAITWSVSAGNAAYLSVSGVTATLYISSVSSSTSSRLNLANNGSGVRPTVSDVSAWMSSTLSGFLGSSNFTCSVVSSLAFRSALVLVEGYTAAPTAIPAATSLNYLQMRLVALLFDLMASDTANMLVHLSPQGAQGMWLDWSGSFYGLARLSLISGGVTAIETDDSYRQRALAMLAQPQENNVAVAQILAEAFGSGNIQVVDGVPGTVTIWIFTPVSQPTLVVPLARKILPAGIGVTCLLFTSDPNSTGARCGTVRCGAVRCGAGSNFTILR